MRAFLLVAVAGAMQLAGPAAAAKQAGASEAAAPPLTPGRQGVTRPQLLEAPMPAYPQAAARNGIHGSVRFSYVVLTSGRVDRITLLASRAAADEEQQLPPGIVEAARGEFEAAARGALRERRFAPAMKKARPVPVLMEVEFEFSPDERLARHRWEQVEAGLHNLARASIIPAAAHLAGSDGVSFPVALKQKAPIQPQGARLRGISSRVLLLVLVNAEGRVADVPLSRAEVQDYPFAEAASAAVRRWQFAPAQKDGVAVEAYHWLRLAIPPESGLR